MSYIPNTWATNDVVTAGKLNHVERGIKTESDTPKTNLIITCDPFIGTTDKTLQEVVDAFLAGSRVQVNELEDIGNSKKAVGYVHYVTYISNLDSLNDVNTEKQIITSAGMNFAGYDPSALLEVL